LIFLLKWVEFQPASRAGSRLRDNIRLSLTYEMVQKACLSSLRFHCRVTTDLFKAAYPSTKGLSLCYKNGVLKINIHVDFELRSFFYEKTPPKAM